MSGALTVKFWGVRGSYPVPGPTTVRFGGNTACVELRADGHTLILDAGTGIIGLGRELLMRHKAAGTPVHATLLFTHMHHDHTQGFPFFTPAYAGATRLDIFGPGIFERDLERILSHVLVSPTFPVSLEEMNALKVMRTMRETKMIMIGADVGNVTMHNLFHEPFDQNADSICVRALHSYAHPSGVLVYRIDWQGKSVVFATDVEGYIHIDQRLVDFARDADVLIHDAQYTEEHYQGKRPGFPTTQGWGHSTPAMACAVAKECGAKQLVLFHHDPQYDDETLTEMEAEAQQHFASTLMAYEGLELVL